MNAGGKYDIATRSAVLSVEEALAIEGARDLEPLPPRPAAHLEHNVFGAIQYAFDVHLRKVKRYLWRRFQRPREMRKNVGFEGSDIYGGILRYIDTPSELHIEDRLERKRFRRHFREFGDELVAVEVSVSVHDISPVCGSRNSKVSCEGEIAPAGVEGLGGGDPIGRSAQ